MSEVKHTPGPWVWRGKDGGLYQEGTTHRFGDAVMVPTYDYDSGIDIEVSEEDALLIAAAPDMLEALEMAKKVIDAIYGNPNLQIAWGIDGKPRPVQESIDYAISKAKGLTQTA